MILKNISFSYGSNIIFDQFSAVIPCKKITTIVGGSGCGKSTLLKIISSILSLSNGTIEFEESEKGSVSYLFQEPRLINTETVFSNVELVLHSSIDNKKERKEKAFYYLDRVGLFEDRLKYPSQLSGGMKQRVAIARAFAYPSHLILMDEPMQGLDIKSRQIVLKLFYDLWENEKRTTLFVTHDLRDALTKGSTVICLGKKKSPIDYIDLEKEYPLSDEKLGMLETRLLRGIVNN